MSNLESLQQWLLSAIQFPHTKQDQEIEAVIADANGQLSPTERIGIYARSFHGRLLQSLEAEYPVLKHALGEELFAQFASGYLHSYPPNSYTLTHLGKNFPKYLRQTRPEDSSELWPEFLIDLATLERTFFEVYHGDGPENSDHPPATKPQEIANEPWTRTLNLAFPTHDYFQAARLHLREPDKHDAPEFPAPQPTALIIYRRDFQVRFQAVEAAPSVIGTNAANS